jgi:hypothetical protein
LLVQLFGWEVKYVKVKTVAFVVLLVIMAGSVYATSVPTTIAADLPTSLFEFFSSLGGAPVALADPVGGGGGTGGND